jgi:fermentation-respiration switch protein FrsA (DUF1100 family)
MKAGKNEVQFKSFGDTVIGNLYCPQDFDLTRKYLAVIVAGPLGTVKEQAGGVFAQKLAEKGFVALAFDYRTQGQSEGVPKNYENPFRKAEDIGTAISFLRTHEFVERDRIGSLGICAGGVIPFMQLPAKEGSKLLLPLTLIFRLGNLPVITQW